MAGERDMLITTGRALSWEEWVKAVDDLEARAELAERHRLHRTARCWREQVKTLRLKLEE
jgi:hypothetical protein